jgi:type I restriction enzyme S subunit
MKPGYKKTEVGVIPEEWEVKALGAFVRYTNGKAHEQSISDSGRFVVVNSKFISTEGLTRKYSQYSFCPASAGDVLMVMSDVPNGRAIAKCYWVESDNTYTVNQRICILNPQGIDGKLLFYKLDRNPFYLAFDDGAKQTNLRKDDVLVCPLGIPKSETEQRAIAEALSDVDALIAGLDKLIAKKRDLKQAAMQQLLNGKTRLPGFIGKWEMKRLGDVVDVVGGGTPSTAIREYWNGDIDWFTPTEISGAKYSGASARKITFEGLANSSARMLPAKTILMTTRASIGDLMILTSDATTNQGFQSLIPKDNMDNEFIYYMMLTKKNELLKHASGSTFLEISPNKVKSIELSVPPLPEQTAIAEVLSDMDTEISALETRLEKTRALKQGMMQELLTGRIRLV